MKKSSYLLYVLGAVITGLLGAAFLSWSDFLVLYGVCSDGDKGCITETNLWVIGTSIIIGIVITGYKYTFGDKTFRIKFVEFFKVPSSDNIHLYPKATEKNKVILKIQNFEWRWLPYIPVFVFVKPVENMADWNGDFSKLDFRNGRNDSYVNLYWLHSKELNFIRISPRENIFRLDSDSNGDVRFSFGKSHRFVVKIFCQYEGKASVYRKSELVVNCKGGHQVQLEIKNDSDNDTKKSRKFFFKQRHFQGNGGG